MHKASTVWVRVAVATWAALAAGTASVSATGGAGAQDTDLTPVEALLADVQSRYRELDTLRQRFEQSAEVRFGLPPRVLTGEWLMRSPGQLRVSYAENGNVFVADGEQIFWYLRNDRQVQVSAQDQQTRRGNALLYLSGQGDLTVDFAASGTEWRTPLALGNVQIRLDPLVEGADYEHLIVEIDPSTHLIARLVTVDLFGTPTEWRFTEIEPDADLAPEAFQFTIPPGVAVENIGG